MPATLLAAGIVIAATAIFAEAMGLDASAGWGRSMIAVLALGLFIIMLGALLYSKSSDRRSELKQPSISSVSWARISGAWRAYWPVIPSVAVVIFIYWFCATSGHLTTWDSPTRYYADLARGFLRGNLFMAVREFQMDYSVYNGRYYLYFGPVPAVLLALISPFVHGRVGDLQLTFTFITLTYLVLCLLAITIWNRFFAALPRYLLVCILPVLGLAGPAAFMLNTYKSGRIYEAAISGGQFFMMAGFLAGLAAVLRPERRGWLVVAGALWALAVGTRWSLLPTVGVMVLGLGAWILMLRSPPRSRLAGILSLTLPLVIGLAALGWYNWSRFGSALETGIYYIDNGKGSEFNKPYSNRFNPAYIPHNLYNYLLHPFGFRPRFAYLQAQDGLTGQLLWFPPAPAEYGTYPVTGALFAAPFFLFAVVAPALSLQTRLKARAVQGRREAHISPELDWLVHTLSVACLVGVALLLTLLAVSPRYAYDAAPCVLLLAVIGFWQGYREVSDEPSRRRSAALGLALAAVSVIVSTLLALSAATGRLA